MDANRYLVRAEQMSESWVLKTNIVTASKWGIALRRYRSAMDSADHGWIGFQYLRDRDTIVARAQ